MYINSDIMYYSILLTTIYIVKYQNKLNTENIY